MRDDLSQQSKAALKRKKISASPGDGAQNALTVWHRNVAKVAALRLDRRDGLDLLDRLLQHLGRLALGLFTHVMGVTPLRACEGKMWLRKR